MKVIILAGGKGTRMGEVTETVPKPMIRIGGRPLLAHVMDCYLRYGTFEFIVAGGYKCEAIKQWSQAENARATVIDTGLETATGGRIKRLAEFIDGTFCVTYGDGVANVNLRALIAKHRLTRALVTVTGVHPPARFAWLHTHGAQVTEFKKGTLDAGWIDGGFMVMESGVLEYISGDDTWLEFDVLPRLAASGRLYCHKHTGYWACVDTLRDVRTLEDAYLGGAPWLK